MLFEMNLKIVYEPNLLLSDKKVVVINQEQSQNPSGSIDKSSSKTQWTAVRAAHALAGEKPLSCVMESLYNQVRTFFQSQT